MWELNWPRNKNDRNKQSKNSEANKQSKNSEVNIQRSKNSEVNNNAQSQCATQSGADDSDEVSSVISTASASADHSKVKLQLSVISTASAATAASAAASADHNNVEQQLSSMSRGSPLFRFPSDKTVKQLRQLTLLPPCIVFDLDDTLWDGDIDYTRGPPFYSWVSNYGSSGATKPNGLLTTALGVDGVCNCTGNHALNNEARGSSSKQVQTAQTRPTLRLFKDVLSIFTWLEFKKVRIAIASRSAQPFWVDKALSLLKTTTGTTYRELVFACECYDTCKQKHMRQICKKLKVELSDIVFYDNLFCNLADVELMPSSVPTVTQYTPSGLDWNNFIEGLMKYQARQQEQQATSQ